MSASSTFSCSANILIAAFPSDASFAVIDPLLPITPLTTACDLDIFLMLLMMKLLAYC